MSAYSKHPRVLIAPAVLANSERVLRRHFWGRSHESIIYWAGCATDEHWIVTTVIAPRATTTAGSYQTSAADNARAIAHACRNGLSMLAQVHTHPGSFVGHSPGDHVGAFMPYNDSLSIVVANYCKEGVKLFDNCGIHRFEHGRFRELGKKEVAECFLIIPTLIDLRA